MFSDVCTEAELERQDAGGRRDVERERLRKVNVILHSLANGFSTLDVLVATKANLRSV